MQEKRLDREFFLTDALELSKKLIGKILVHETHLGKVRGIITETEAYMGVEDKGSHTYGGKRTERTEPMFHIGGTSYVYFIYGMYNCVNVTAGKVDVPMAALIRMVEPADEDSRRIMEQLRLQDMERRRQAREERKRAGEATQCKEATGNNTEASCKGASRNELSATVLSEPMEKHPDKLPASIRKHLADGPGKLCIAMAITKNDNDVDLVTADDFYLTEGVSVDDSRISLGKRIGIDYAEEAADYLWRFTLT